MSAEQIVYALQGEDELVALFSTEEMAIEAQRQHGTGEVKAWQIDSLVETVQKNLPQFQLRMLHDGTLGWIRDCKGIWGTPYVWIAGDFSCMYVTCRAENEDAAIALANDQRLAAIKEGRWPEPEAYWAPFNAANGFAVYPQPAEAQYV